MKKLLLTIGFATLTGLFSVTAQVVNPSPTQGNPKDNVPGKEIPPPVTSDTALTEGAIVMDSTMIMNEDSFKKNAGDTTMKKEEMQYQKTKEEKKQMPMNKKKAE